MHFLMATPKIHNLHFYVNPLCGEKVLKEEAENAQT